MDSTGWTDALEQKDVREELGEDLRARALDEWFGRRMELWKRENQWLSRAAWPLLVLACLSGIFSFPNSLTPSPALVGLSICGSLSTLLLILSCAIVPYSIASTLRLPQEVLLSFEHSLLFNKQMLVMQRSAQGWLLRFSLVPALFTCAGYLMTKLGSQLDYVALALMCSAILLPTLLLACGMEAVIKFVLLRSGGNSAFAVCCAYGGLFVLYLGAMASIYFISVILMSTNYVPAHMVLSLMFLPQTVLAFAALLFISVVRLRRRKMPPGYSGGLLLDR